MLGKNDIESSKVIIIVKKNAKSVNCFTRPISSCGL